MYPYPSPDPGRAHLDCLEYLRVIVVVASITAVGDCGVDARIRKRIVDLHADDALRLAGATDRPVGHQSNLSTNRRSHRPAPSAGVKSSEEVEWAKKDVPHKLAVSWVTWWRIGRRVHVRHIKVKRLPQNRPKPRPRRPSDDHIFVAETNRPDSTRSIAHRSNLPDPSGLGLSSLMAPQRKHRQATQWWP